MRTHHAARDSRQAHDSRQAAVGKTASTDRGKHAEDLARLHNVLDELAGSPDVTVRRMVASHPEACKETLIRLADDDSRSVRRAIVTNGNAPGEALRRIAGKGEPDFWYYLAFNPSTPVDVLRELFEKPGGLMGGAGEEYSHKIDRAYLLSGVAGNPNADAAILRELAKNTESSVRINATMRLIDGALLDMLADDPHGTVRLEVANNPHTEEATLARLAKEQNPHIRSAVASNEATGEATLEELALDESARVRKAVFTNVNYQH